MRSKKIFLATLIILLFVLVSRFYGFSIYTYFWHQMNPEPIKWGTLEVTIPRALVAEIIRSKDANEELEITLIENRIQATIYFIKETHHMKDSFNIEGMFLSKGYHLIEKKTCIISGLPCVWIKARRELKEVNYSENIFFPSKSFHIAFFGHVHQRKYLLEVIEGLKFTL